MLCGFESRPPIYRSGGAKLDYSKSDVQCKILYEASPKTTGCDKCGQINGVRKHWCCTEQQPVVTLAEFHYLWKTLDRDRQIEIFKKTISDLLTLAEDEFLGCPFYNGHCSIYDIRPLECRLFGIEPAKVKELRKEKTVGSYEPCDIPGKTVTLKQYSILTGYRNRIETDLTRRVLEDTTIYMFQHILVAAGFSMEGFKELRDRVDEDIPIEQVLSEALEKSKL